MKNQTKEKYQDLGVDEFKFDITESAINQIKNILKENQQGLKLRISVDGGGCSGFSYKYEFVKDSKESDFRLTKNGVCVLIDPISQKFLSNSALNFIENLGSSCFEIKNPNAKMKCGCGNSFDI